MKAWDEMTEREQLEITHYEMYRDCYGFRNREYPYAEKTDEQLREDMEWMQARMADDLAEEERREAAAIERFEAKLNDLQHCIAGCGTRAQALRWLLESLGDQYTLSDPDYACYEFGLPYGYLNKEELFA